MTQPVIILLTSNIREGASEEVTQLFEEIIPVTLKYDGCLGITHHRKPENPNKMLMIERWASFDAYRGYVAWRDSTGDLTRLMELLDGPPSIEVWAL